MNDTPKITRQAAFKTYMKRILMTAFVILFVIYSWAIWAPFLFDASNGMVSYLFSVAQGDHLYSRNTNLDNLEWERPAPKMLSEEPACTRRRLDGELVENAPYLDCIHLFPWPSGPGCAHWRFEACEPYMVDDFILTQPDVLGRTLNALHEPCNYLPTKEDLKRGRTEGKHVHRIEKHLKYMGCLSGADTVPIAVSINVRNDEGEVIMQFRYEPSAEKPLTLFHDP